ncbi:MAG: hotdog fold thioesterase [Flavobacteriaceae bacterium]|jgi:1,4-dihydroxy-2-naphthoyl-CoA hydrolase|nr:hotdog fold thioesterase [Flavobacteriaceae bacterium]
MFNKNFKESILNEANDRCKGTLVSTLGIIFTDVGEHFLEAKMKVTPNLHQPAGVLHGGATAALAETVGSSAAAIFSMKKNQMLRGVELSINHVRGISEGYVYARAVPVHMGRTMQLWKITIIDEDNRDISFAKLTTLTIDK